MSETHKLTAGNVPVDGFWSLAVYNSERYLQPNQYNAYSVNSITAIRARMVWSASKFGGCNGKIENCLPIAAGDGTTPCVLPPAGGDHQRPIAEIHLLVPGSGRSSSRMKRPISPDERREVGGRRLG